MNTWTTVIGRFFAVAVPLALGVGAILYSGTIKSAAFPKENVAQPVPVRVIMLAEVDLVPRVTGYGVVAPAHEWRRLHRVAVMGDDDELHILAQFGQHLAETPNIHCVHFVHHADGGRRNPQQGKNQRNGGQAAFAARNKVFMWRVPRTWMAWC